MANKRQRKKRMKKLKLMEKGMVAKQSPVKQQQLTNEYLPPNKDHIVFNIDCKREEQKALYQQRLDKVYNSAVVALNDYINPKAVIVHKCTDCGLVFFGKPSHMVGKEHQRHSCNLPYGTASGERKATVSTIKDGKAKRSKMKNKEIDMELLNKMIWEDYSYKKIASELNINPNIVRDYFKSEGLIE